MPPTRDQRALVRQVAHEHVHALAFLLQQAVGGHAHVLEEQFGGVLRVEAHLVEHATDAIALQALRFDHQDRQAAAALVRDRCARPASGCRR